MTLTLTADIDAGVSSFPMSGAPTFTVRPFLAQVESEQREGRTGGRSSGPRTGPARAPTLAQPLSRLSSPSRAPGSPPVARKCR